MINMNPHNTISEKVEEFEKLVSYSGIHTQETGAGIINVKEVSDFLRSALESQLEEVRGIVVDMPSRCIKCEKLGVNIYGECICSYEDKGYIKKNDLLAVIKK